VEAFNNNNNNVGKSLDLRRTVRRPTGGMKIEEWRGAEVFVSCWC
jgi:hypothetical protein